MTSVWMYLYHRLSTLVINPTKHLVTARRIDNKGQRGRDPPRKYEAYQEAQAARKDREQTNNGRRLKASSKRTFIFTGLVEALERETATECCVHVQASQRQQCNAEHSTRLVHVSHLVASTTLQALQNSQPQPSRGNASCSSSDDEVVGKF